MENTKYSFILSMDGIQVAKIDTEICLSTDEYLAIKGMFANFRRVPTGNLSGALYQDSKLLQLL